MPHMAKSKSLHFQGLPCLLPVRYKKDDLSHPLEYSQVFFHYTLFAHSLHTLFPRGFSAVILFETSDSGNQSLQKHYP